MLACAVLAVPAAAALYKWTDANGRVVYSDQPPMGDVKSELVRGASPPSNPNAVKDLAAKELELKKRDQQAAESTQKADTQRAEVVKRNEQCLRMQDQARQLAATQVALVRINTKGEQIVMDEASRRKELEQTQTWIRGNCGPG
jgi:Domain of unknown function (DUF4124)